MLYQDYISEEFDLSGKRVLVVAPSVGEKRLFKKWGAETVSIDIRPDIKPDIVANICDMPEVPGESFDCVVASYVFCLNYDHNAALREFARVLRPGGRLFSHDPIQFGKPTRENSDREQMGKWYGQEALDTYRVGSFRSFGDSDLIEDVSRHFLPRTFYGRDPFIGTKIVWICGLKR